MKQAMRDVSVTSAACVILIMLAATRNHTSGPVPTPKNTVQNTKYVPSAVRLRTVSPSGESAAS